MSINFISLKKSESELNNNFSSLIELTRKMGVRLYSIIENKKVTQEDIDKIESYKSRITELRHDIRDDCIWTISKDQPRANHLRFIIAILYSLKDIERISDYLWDIVKTLKKEKISIDMINNLEQLMKNSIVFFDKVIETLNDESLNSYEDEIYSMFSKFRESYKLFLTNTVKTFAKKSIVNKNIEKYIEYYFNFSVVIKYVDRIVDHYLHIYKNFLLVKGSN